MVQVKEKNLEEIKAKLNEINTDLNQIAYLESALKKEFTYEIKRFIWDKLVELYEARKMYEKAGKAMAYKAGIDVAFRDKIESYLKAAELYARGGKIEDAEAMFLRAERNANLEQKQKIKLAMKNIFLVSAQELERAGKKASATRFYEKLIKMKLDEIEKEQIKKKLIETYKSLGKFDDAELVGGL